MKFFGKLGLMLSSMLALCGCSGVDLLNYIIPNTGYTIVKDLSYGNDDRQKLDIYRPDNPAPGNPVIVFFYGGSWRGGSKNDYLFVGQAFASQGFTTVIADYRVYPQVKYPDFLDDCAAAVVWAHQHIGDYNGNSSNLFVSGHSAGGYNAIMVATNPHYIIKSGGKLSWLRGAIGIAGPYDFLPLTDDKLIEIFGNKDGAQTQPVTYVTHHLPPMLLVTGTDDTDVIPRNTIRMADKLRDYNDSVETRFYPGVAHIGIALSLAYGFRGKASTLKDITNFINTHTEVR